MFKLLMKGVQAHGEVDEEELDDALLKANEDRHRLYKLMTKIQISLLTTLPKKAAAPAKKAPANGPGKKAAVLSESDSDDKPPKTRRINRAAVLRCVYGH